MPIQMQNVYKGVGTLTLLKECQRISKAKDDRAAQVEMN